MASTTSLTTEVSDAFGEGKRGCVLCSLWTSEEATLTGKIRKEGLQLDSKLREKVVAASGFCNRHTHVLHKVEGGPGCAECSRAVLKKLEGDLAALLPGLQAATGTGKDTLATTIGQLERTISGDAVCPVCEKLLESDKQRVTSLLQMLEDKDFAERYGKSDAMCMPHFVTAMRLLQGLSLKDLEGAWSLLVRAEVARLSSVDNLLNERMRKYSWDFRSEGISPEEVGAQKTGMLAIVGVEGLYCRPQKTSLRPMRT